MSNINVLVMEALQQDQFKMTGVLNNIVYKKVKEAKDRQNIRFDLENNDPVGDIRKVYAELEKKDSIRDKNTFMCRMYSAGGDWEYPVRYFVCQLIDGWCNTLGIRSHGGENSFFVYIPISGNRLNLTEKGYCAFDDGEVKKEDVPEIDEKKCWNDLIQYLTNISNVPMVDGE